MQTGLGLLAMARHGSLQKKLQSLSLDDVEEIGKELGRGAYGVVYEVRVSGLVCAGKTLHEAIVQNETLVKFVEECFCHSQQRHPNIVQLMGVHFSRHSRLPMLVMEYLPLSLTQCLETHHDLPLQIKYSILLDVAKGLNYLHCKKPPIVHRDLTANNILLTSNFIAKISDLGISRMADTFKQQQLTKAPGNVVVMPPEALKDNPSYDHKLDVFSYGCLILHVFTHQWPAPTDQYVPSTSPSRIGSFDLVTEWNRRSKYTTAISSDNPFFSFTKSCLDNDPKKRPTMSDAIICAQHAVSSLPPLKSQLELMKEIDLLTDQMDHLRRQVQEETHTWEGMVKQLKEDKGHYVTDLTKSWQAKAIVDVCFAAQKQEIAEKSKLLNQEMNRASKLEKEMLSSMKVEMQAKKELRQIEATLSISNKENADLQFEIARLQSALSSLQESNSGLQSLLKSKDNDIEVLQAQCKSTSPGYQIQKEIIQRLLAQELKEGDEWYLVCQRWFTQWKRYVGYDSVQSVADSNSDQQPMAGKEADHPGLVNNTDLFKESESVILKANLKEGDNFVLLPKPVWDLFVSWYGLLVGSRPICRYVMKYNNDLKVGIYPLEVKLCVYPHVNEKVTFCEGTTLNTIVQKMREFFNLSTTTDECRLWIYRCEKNIVNTCVLIARDFDSVLEDKELEYDDIVVHKLMFEIRNQDGSWPKTIKLKLCVYPNTNDIKQWSFDMFDTVDTALQKTRELFNISTTNECRLWHWNLRQDDHFWFYTLSDVKETVAGICCFDEEEKIYFMWEFALNNKMPFILEVRNPDGSWPWRIQLCLLVYGEVSLKTLSFGVFNNISTVFKKMSDLVSANECSLIESDFFDKPFAILKLYLETSDGSLSKKVSSVLYRDDANTKWLVNDETVLDIINQEMVSENSNGIYYVMTLSKELLTTFDEDN